MGLEALMRTAAEEETVMGWPAVRRALPRLLCWVLLLQAGPAVAESVAGLAEEKAADSTPAVETPEGHQRSWERVGETVTVIGKAPELREEERIGEYHQPRWTARRRFGETRVYVIPEGDFELEYWLVPEIPRRGGETVSSPA